MVLGVLISLGAGKSRCNCNSGNYSAQNPTCFITNECPGNYHRPRRNLAQSYRVDEFGFGEPAIIIDYLLLYHGDHDDAATKRAGPNLQKHPSQFK